MLNSYASPCFTTNYSRNNRLVVGLRDSEKPTECRVFKENTDGSIGKLLRVEEPVDFNITRNNGGR